MKKTISNIFYNCASQLLAIIVPLITSPYISRVLGPQNLGVYSYIDSVSQIFAVVGALGLTNYGIREIAYVKNNKKERSNIFYELLILRVILLIFTFILYYWFMNGTKYEVYSFYQLIWFVGSFGEIIWFYNGIEDFKTVVLRTSLVKTVCVILIFLFIKNPNDIWKYILIMGGCQVFGVLICYPSISKLVSGIDLKELHVFRHLKATVKIALPQIVILIYYQMDKVMLEYFTHDSALIAFYDQADKIVKIPVTAISAVSSVMLPRSSNLFVNNDSNALNESIRMTAKYTILLIMPMTLGIIAISYGFVPWFYGKGYDEVAPIIIALSPVIIARGLSSISSAQYLIPTKNTKYLTLSSVISAILNVIINYITIPVWGVYGAVLGTILAEFSVTIIQYYFMAKVINLKGLWKISFKYLLFAIIAVIPCYFIGIILEIHIYTTVIQIVCAIFVYLLLLVVTKDSLLKILSNKNKGGL